MTEDRSPEFYSQYPKHYGKHYLPVSPNFSLCAKGVRGHYASKQCSRPNGHGPHGAWCKQHDPAVVKARADARDAARKAKWGKEKRLHSAVAALEPALRKIADGANDAREIAQKVISELDEARK